MKQFLLLFILGIICLPALQGQNAASIPLGINFQAVARDLDGQVKTEMPVYLRMSLTSADEEAEVFYSEEHAVRTDEIGLFNVLIGQGESILGNTLLDVPWAKGDIWLSIEMATGANPNYQLVSNTQMLAVPIALYADQADYIENEEVLLRNQSIYWNTSGNREVRPDHHFLGTQDGEDLVIKTNNQERARFTQAGQLQITAGTLDGKRSDSSVGSYPVTVEGSDQGIYIKVDENRSTSNNFVTFADNKQIWGTVEGQTYLERTTSTNYIIEATLFAIKITSYAVQTASDFAEGAGLFASLFGAGAAPGALAEAINKLAAGISLGTQLAAWIAKNAVCAGVSFTSGSADYAEYLLRDPNSIDIIPGEIIGVNGGIVSLNTQNADHIMVVSSMPIVLGNLPTEGKEDLYEKVAFMGQVPVRVVGAVSVGDYILPSGNNDGLGIAVCPDDMDLGDYSRIVGVAWEAADDNLLNVINVAIGINAEDMSQRAELLNRQVDNIMDYLEGNAPLISDPALLQGERKGEQAMTSVQKLFSDEEFMAVIDEHSDVMVDIFDNARSILESQDFDFSLFPGLEELFENPTAFIKEIRKAPDYTTQWHFADKKLKEILEKRD